MKQTTISDFNNCPAMIVAESMSGFGSEEGFTSGLKRMPECDKVEMTLLGHGKNNADGVQLALFTPDGTTVHGFNATPFCIQNGCFSAKEKSEFLKNNKGTAWLVSCHYADDGSKTVTVEELQEEARTNSGRGRRN